MLHGRFFRYWNFDASLCTWKLCVGTFHLQFASPFDSQ